MRWIARLQTLIWSKKYFKKSEQKDKGTRHEIKKDTCKIIWFDYWIIAKYSFTVKQDLKWS